MKIITFEDIKKIKLDPMLAYRWTEEMIMHKSETYLPPKISMHREHDIFCNVMPCMIDKAVDRSIGGVKVVTRYPERKPSLDSKLILMDMETGEFLALMDANWITAMRTGAVAAHSINLLARKDFKTISFIGLGNTARATMIMLEGLFRNRNIEVRLMKYSNQHEIFKERFQDYDNIHFTDADNVTSLIKGSDVIISCVTAANADFAEDSNYDEGVLVVPVHTRGFTNCDLFFDKVFADDRGHVSHFKNFDKFRYFAEVSDVVTHKCYGRENDSERIIAYNIGISIHDIYFAYQIYNLLEKDVKSITVDMQSPSEKFWI